MTCLCFSKVRHCIKLVINTDLDIRPNDRKSKWKFRFNILHHFQMMNVRLIYHKICRFLIQILKLQFNSKFGNCDWKYQKPKLKILGIFGVNASNKIGWINDRPPETAWVWMEQQKTQMLWIRTKLLRIRYASKYSPESRQFKSMSGLLFFLSLNILHSKMEIVVCSMWKIPGEKLDIFRIS